MFDELIEKSKKASLKFSSYSHDFRCKLIQEIAESLIENTELILEANKTDLEFARKENITSALLDRLKLTKERILSMSNSMIKLIKIQDPLGEENSTSWLHLQGMQMKKIRVPLGVILVVYEARPNVTTDTTALCIKTANACILRGSRQTKNSNRALGDCINKILKKYNLEDLIKIIEELSHEDSLELIKHKKLDLIIPRGGEKLKAIIKENAFAPVLGAGGGVCHAYISEHADLNKASEIIFNAKTQRPSVCNALEAVILNKKIINSENLRILFDKLINNKNNPVCIKADEFINNKFNNKFELASQEDCGKEYLDFKLFAKSVESLEEAIEYINKYGTGHSDCIITENTGEAENFCKLVDSACVYVNSSTRFTDGEEFGFGAEIGISTQKLHARGPIGPQELTSYKYLILGDGQIRN